jgi:hypothetical protein
MTDPYDPPRPLDDALQEELESLREQEREGHATPKERRRAEQVERRLRVDEHRGGDARMPQPGSRGRPAGPGGARTPSPLTRGNPTPHVEHLGLAYVQVAFSPSTRYPTRPAWRGGVVSILRGRSPMAARWPGG